MSLGIKAFLLIFNILYTQIKYLSHLLSIVPMILLAQGTNLGVMNVLHVRFFNAVSIKYSSFSITVTWLFFYLTHKQSVYVSRRESVVLKFRPKTSRNLLFPITVSIFVCKHAEPNWPWKVSSSAAREHKRVSRGLDRDLTMAVKVVALENPNQIFRGHRIWTLCLSLFLLCVLLQENDALCE